MSVGSTDKRGCCKSLLSQHANSTEPHENLGLLESFLLINRLPSEKETWPRNPISNPEQIFSTEHCAKWSRAGQAAG
jgi:hypothetical protein